jgi:hypothetical protein
MIDHVRRALHHLGTAAAAGLSLAVATLLVGAFWFPEWLAQPWMLQLVIFGAVTAGPAFAGLVLLGGLVDAALARGARAAQTSGPPR